MLSGINFHPIFLIVAGILLALFGYKIQKIVLTLASFALGFTLSNAIMPNIINDNTIVLVFNIVIGILISGIGLKLEKFAIGSAVAYIAYLSLDTYANILPFDLTPIIQAAISLAVGITAMLLIRPILIITTSIGGVSILLSGLSNYIEIPNNIYLIILIVAIALCALVQFKTNKR